MKKYLTLFLAIALILSLASCGKKKTAESADDSSEVTSEVNDTADTAGTADSSDVTDVPGVPTDIPLPSQDTFVPEPAEPDNPMGNRPVETHVEGGYGTDVALGNSDEEYTPEIINDEQTLTWVIGPVTYQVVHDGTNVISYKSVTEYDSNELAEQAYKAYVDLGPEPGDAIKSIERKGNKIITEYNDEARLTLEQAKEQAALFAAE